MKFSIKKIPGGPGVYIMKDSKGDVLYIGKAKDLRERVKSYFGRGANERYQIKFLMERLSKIKTIQTKNEKEAVLLEYKLIQKYKPRYNIELKDNKTFVSVRLGVEHPFPSISVTRKVKKDGAEYYGPYPSAVACRETVEQIIRFFRLRSCSTHEFANRSRPCILHYIGKSSAPCVGKISKAEYAEQVENVRLFLRGKKRDLLKKLRLEMKHFSDAMRFEEAARLRNVISGIKKTLEKQSIMRPEEQIRHDDLNRDEIYFLGDLLQKKLKLTATPHIIECVDISNIGGRIASGSIVCFIDGKAEKSRYRLFNITRKEEPNDYAMMYETLERRFRHPEWPFPDLLMVDGGRGQLGIAIKALQNLGIKNVPVIAIAKTKNSQTQKLTNSKTPAHIYLPNRINPVSFKANDPALLYLTKIRDEAHRFGIQHYRRRHIKYTVSKKLS